jgi:pimeloyl-ACP methyl ester carboxylesterase
MTTLVLIHGAHNDHTVWAPLAAPLSAQLARHGVAVLAPDLPGHGAARASNAGAALASVEAMADWLLATLAAHGVEQALLAGHSMGSLIALEAAHRAPERVAGLALLGSTWPMKVAPALLETALNDEPAAIRTVAQWSHADPDCIPASLALMERISAANPARGLHRDLNACNSYANGETAARAVHCPVLFIVGAQDRMTPARAGARLRDAIPHARTVEVEAGHQMMAEQPDAVLAALLDFAGAQ